MEKTINKIFDMDNVNEVIDKFLSKSSGWIEIDKLHPWYRDEYQLYFYKTLVRKDIYGNTYIGFVKLLPKLELRNKDVMLLIDIVKKFINQLSNVYDWKLLLITPLRCAVFVDREQFPNVIITWAFTKHYSMFTDEELYKEYVIKNESHLLNLYSDIIGNTRRLK